MKNLSESNKKHIVIISGYEEEREKIESFAKRLFPEAETRTFIYADGGLNYIRDNDDAKKNPENWIIFTGMSMPLFNEATIEERAGRSIIGHLSSENFCIDVMIICDNDVNDEFISKIYSYYLGHMSVN